MVDGDRGVVCGGDGKREGGMVWRGMWIGLPQPRTSPTNTFTFLPQYLATARTGRTLPKNLRPLILARATLQEHPHYKTICCLYFVIKCR